MYKKILTALFLLSSCHLSGQHFLTTNGKAIVNETGDTIILRGMGLGGWMLQEGYMLQTADFANAQFQIKAKIEALIGTENTQIFYDAWLRNHVTKSDIDSLKSWGFNSVRLPMHYKLFTLPIEEESISGENTWLEIGFELTDSLIRWCKENEMYVVLDLHGAPGGQGQDQAISDYDPSKPSLWESKENRNKTVALWKKLAARYVNEPWVAGYDLINEPNWNLPNNKLLADLYKEITDSIRSIDNAHIIFIEGNWFANDFTGLTPPWDKNMVYAPHKYWSINDEASIQWVLDLRENYNIPLYLGESGENSNVWFRDAIELLEYHDIGWAWWPMKKIESIAGPLSIIKTAGYESLLNFWRGNGPQPSPDSAFTILMDLTEKLKIQHCIFQQDVIDAMFRQVYSSTTLPFTKHLIPGIIYATDFDLGQLGEAYHDIDVANYQVSTGQFNTWNTGWAYRNDAVDIEKCSDNINTNGYNIGWIETGEWLQYSPTIKSSGLYDISLRVASPESKAKIHFSIGSADVTESLLVPNTGGWQNWKTLVVPDVALDPTDKNFRLVVDNGGFNLNSFEFVRTGNTNSLPTQFQSALTIDKNTIQLNLNKNSKNPDPNQNTFIVTADGTDVETIDFQLDSNNSRIIQIGLMDNLRFDDVIRISYSGSSISGLDETLLSHFTNEPVQNTLPIFYSIPGKIEAENYFNQSGIQLENTTDVNGGSNIGFLDPGDFLDYHVGIETPGKYKLSYRNAGLSALGRCSLILIDNEGNELPITTSSLPATGGWQVWQNQEAEIILPAGDYTMRLLINQGQFNLNWLEFSLLEEPEEEKPLGVFLNPNPIRDRLFLKANFSVPHKATIRIFNILGQAVLIKSYQTSKAVNEEIQLGNLASGQYYFEVSLEDDTQYLYRIIKI